VKTNVETWARGIIQELTIEQLIALRDLCTFALEQADVCEHGVPTFGNGYCPECREDYRRARMDPENGIEAAP
jgi:hypothetical protein